ncbi:C39 family peptidase [Streptomyces carpinensis]|uniref:C39 family peptidase n=1 Tax=Streptomyces carpinensis TaxID=66369 RepID=A0ABV1W2Y2_9ACTN|nr:C39 family peptidase [Streptomyces carpinensis]
MRALTITHPVPYYSQWESAALVPEFITGRRDAADDPLWQKSGADSPQEYAFWAPRMCGVACLRMALDYWGRPVPPSVPLVKELCEAGAYVREGDQVKGLIYRPFAEHVTARWGLAAEAAPELPAARVAEAVTDGGLVLLSVHKTIRTADERPPSKGGHLVLAVGTREEALMVHNPSGLPGISQKAHEVPWERLDRFYAGRGVILSG